MVAERVLQRLDRLFRLAVLVIENPERAENSCGALAEILLCLRLL